MTASTWLIIAIVAFSLSGVAAVVAVIMFFGMNIPAVIGDLSGKTVAREIQAIRAERSSDQPRKTRYDRYERRAASRTGGLNTGRTNSLGASRRLDRNYGRSGALEQAPVETTTVLAENQTTPLEGNATTLLGETVVTTVLSDEGATTVLRDENATTVLGNTAELSQRAPVPFEIIRSMILVQSAEVIR